MQQRTGCAIWDAHQREVLCVRLLSVMGYQLCAAAALQNLAVAYPVGSEQGEPLAATQPVCFVSQDYWGTVLSSRSRFLFQEQAWGQLYAQSAWIVLLQRPSCLCLGTPALYLRGPGTERGCL